MTIRKSSRVRSLSRVAKESFEQTTNKKTGAEREDRQQPASKRRRLVAEESSIEKERSEKSEEGSDKIDPVERLLSLPNHNSDILLSLEDENSYNRNGADQIPTNFSGTTGGPSQISLNFTKILNESLKSYYSNFGKCHLEIYNDNSSFSFLNRAQTLPQEYPQNDTQITQNEDSRSTDIPFFKNVNFNSKPSTSYTFDEYLSYEGLTGDEGSEDENTLNANPSSSSSSTASESPSDPKTPQSTSPLLAQSKMSFHYRRNDKLNLSLNTIDNEDQNDIFKILNKRSIMTGRASEMVSTGNFLINDFFL